MELLTIPTAILAVLGLVAAGGAATAWWKRSEGMTTINLLKTNISSYEISEKQHLLRIAELEKLLDQRDKALAQSRATLKEAVKEFKEYRNGK